MVATIKAGKFGAFGLDNAGLSVLERTPQSWLIATDLWSAGLLQ